MFIDFGAELKGKETSIVTHQPFRLNSLGTAFLQLLALKSQRGLSSTDMVLQPGLKGVKTWSDDCQATRFLEKGEETESKQIKAREMS